MGVLHYNTQQVLQMLNIYQQAPDSVTLSAVHVLASPVLSRSFI